VLIKVDVGFLYDAFLAIREHGGIAAVHAEDDAIIERMKRRLVADERFGLESYALVRPDFAEEMAINDVGILARETGARAYAVHVSSRKGLDAGRRAKASGAPFFMECVPHYLVFTGKVFSREPDEAARFVMGPPYRTEEDIAALWEGIADGSIDWMGSDHSPYTSTQKTRDLRFYADPAGTPGGIEYAIPTGLGGVELLLPIMLSEGVNKGRLTLERLVALMCEKPARTLGLERKGALAVGMDADIAIVDLSLKRTVRNADLHSTTDFTLYEGMEIKGWPVTTISRGEIIVSEGRLTARPGRGRLAPRVRHRARHSGSRA